MPKLRNIYKILDPEILTKNLVELNRQVKGRYWDWKRPDSPDPVFIVGCSRSGTTVTYETFASSAELLSLGYEIPKFWNTLWGPEKNNWASEAAVQTNAHTSHREAAQRFFYQRLGSGRVLDKTCINVMRLPYLYQLFPDATFVYIHRDGRDNISSLMNGWRYDGHFGLSKFLGDSPERVAINNGEFCEWSFFLPPGWRDFNQSTLEEVCAYQWITANQMALEAKKLIPAEQWVQLRYEDIFDAPVEMFKDAFQRLNITFDDTIRERCENLSSRHTSIVKGTPKQRKWEIQNPEAILSILDKISPLMLELGYDPHD